MVGASGVRFRGGGEGRGGRRGTGFESRVSGVCILRKGFERRERDIWPSFVLVSPSCFLCHESRQWKVDAFFDLQ